MHSLHDVQEMNTYTTDNVCLSVRTIQLEKRWTDLDGILYGRYVIGGYPELLQSLIPTWRTNEFVR
jgi:hypothetical protein